MKDDNDSYEAVEQRTGTADGYDSDVIVQRFSKNCDRSSIDRRCQRRA